MQKIPSFVKNEVKNPQIDGIVMTVYEAVLGNSRKILTK